MIGNCSAKPVLLFLHQAIKLRFHSFTLSQQKHDILKHALPHNILIRKFQKLLIIVHGSHV